MTHVRSFSRHRSRPSALHLDPDRRGGVFLADRVQCAQHPKPGGADGARVSLSDHRARAAADTQHPARARRHRHLPDHRDLHHHFPALLHRALYSSQRVLIAMDERPWGAAPNGIVLTVRLTPKGARDAIEGIERLADRRCALKVRVRAAPSEGAANAALVALIAKAAGVAK